MSFMEFVGQQQANMNGLIEQIADQIRTGVDEQNIYAQLLAIMTDDKERAATVAVMATYRLAQFKARAQSGVGGGA